MDPPAAWPRLPRTPRPERAEAPVSTLSGVGPALDKKLAQARPAHACATCSSTGRTATRRRYRERRIADLLAEEEAAIAGEVRSVSVRRPRRNLAIVNARVGDESGEIVAVWFNQAWLEEKLQPGTRVRLRGQLKRNGFQVRAYDLNGVAATADFAPGLPGQRGGDAAAAARAGRAGAAGGARPARPAAGGLKAAEGLPLRADALWALHRPRSLEEGEAGRRRLAFDELLVLQVGLARARAGREAAVAPALGEPGELVARYRELLPFELTADQDSAIAELDRDLAREAPMQRLLQGDVGSGKTVVALYALLRAVETDRLGALMAPTETLAEQHFLTIEPLCTQLGVRVALLTGSVKSELAGAQIVVGTHALIQEGVDLPELAVAVVDEQHRFGVEQRRALTEGRAPHVLHMTATPIPRTLALTLYGDLSVTRDRQAAGLAQADRHRLGDGRALVRRLQAAARAPRRGAAGVRRLPADRGVRDLAVARGRGRGRAAARGPSCATTASACCTGGCGRPSGAS